MAIQNIAITDLTASLLPFGEFKTIKLKKNYISSCDQGQVRIRTELLAYIFDRSYCNYDHRKASLPYDALKKWLNIC